MNYRIFLLLILLLLPFSVFAETVSVDLEIPALKVQPYHRPYVAVWVETEKRKGIKTIAVWHDKNDWLKDMRQWWRKLGRKGAAYYDTATGATRKPGQYSVTWDGLDALGKKLPSGNYYLCVEASREEGGRDFLKQKISLGSSEAQVYQLEGKLELGKVKIRIQ